MRISWETLVAAVLIAASILFVGRYQISAIGSRGQGIDMQAVYRLDRWTGKVVDLCHEKTTPWGTALQCPESDVAVQRAK